MHVACAASVDRGFGAILQREFKLLFHEEIARGSSGGEKQILHGRGNVRSEECFLHPSIVTVQATIKP